MFLSHSIIIAHPKQSTLYGKRLRFAAQFCLQHSTHGEEGWSATLPFRGTFSDFKKLTAPAVLPTPPKIGNDWKNMLRNRYARCASRERGAWGLCGMA